MVAEIGRGYGFAVAGLLERLIAAPGLYVGTGDGVGSGEFIGRFQVTVLPSGTAVAFDYEAFGQNEGLQHAEHTVLARDQEGRLSMFGVHSEAPVPVMLTEQTGGFFMDLEPVGSYVMAIQMALDGGDLSYSWWWASQGEELVERSRAVMHRVDPGAI
jgi:hypothetical protein